MEAIQICLETVKGTATLIESSTLDGIWKICFGDKYLLIKHSYIHAQTYTLLEHSNDVDSDKALNQVSVIMWQIDQFIKNNRPKPPKRYR